MGTSTGRVRDPVTGRPGDQMMGRSWGRPRDVGHICFLNSTQKHIKGTLMQICKSHYSMCSYKNNTLKVSHS